MTPNARRPLSRAVGALTVTLLASFALPAFAQLGLDLTEETQQPARPKKGKKPAKPPPAPKPAEQQQQPPAPPPQDMGGFGLDLTGDTPRIDLRPTLALIGVAVKPSGGGPITAPGATDRALAERITSTLLGEARKSGSFQVLTPDEVRTKLALGYADALRCAEPQCLERILRQLDAERALIIQLTPAVKETQVRLIGFSRAQRSVETADVENEGPPRDELQTAIADNAQPMLQKLAAPLAVLKVTPTPATAKVLLGGVELGTGAIEKKVSAGTYLLRITADGMAPFERDITLEPGGALDVPVSLSSLQPGARVAAYEDPDMAPGVRASAGGGPAIWSRPGFYVALGGLAVVAAGAGMGAMAQSVGARAVDANGDGVLDITRGEALAAERNALLGNILMGVGGAAIAGGAAWMFIAPSPRPASAAVGSGGMGLTVVAGGTF